MLNIKNIFLFIFHYNTKKYILLSKKTVEVKAQVYVVWSKPGVKRFGIFQLNLGDFGVKNMRKKHVMKN